MDTKSILVMGKSSILVEGIGKLLEDDPRTELVTILTSRDTNMPILERVPDVVVYVVFDKDRAIKAVREIRQKIPNVRLIVISRYCDKKFIRQLLKKGVHSIFLDDTPFSELLHAILNQRGKQRQITLDARIVHALADISTGEDRRVERGNLSTLTPAERRVFQLVVSGQNSKEISARLNISPKTVDVHRRRIMDKLKVFNIVELVKLAVREGIAEAE